MARVAVDISLPHLDRPFEYLVPDTMAEPAVPGCQVRVRFAGQLTGGFLLERAPTASTRDASATWSAWSRPSRC